MSGRKKKLSLKLKRYNVLLIVALVVLMLLLTTLMIFQMVGNNEYYKVESREDNISKSRKIDTPDHETIGWIRVQGTNIDYPVYGVLSTDFDYPIVSNSFTWSLNHDSDYHNVMLVYGHNVMNLGPYPRINDETFERMEQLMGFVYLDFAQQNQYIQLSMNGETYLYKIFAAGFMKPYLLNEFPEGEFDEDVKKMYLEEIQKRSIYDYDVEVDEKDNIISVITCSRFFQDDESYDFMVTGRLVKSGEAIEPSTVHRNKNYDEVYEILKGADGHESTENA
ncbi:MAG: class B sortase [Bacilli bacterium]|nr:class B sortase [Bacilli bacterium]